MLGMSYIAKRCFLILAIACFAQPLIAGGDGSLPNVLVILADDLGVNDVSSYGGTNANTPSIDEIAGKGMRFTRFYAELVCSPARAALLTGMSPAALGFQPNGRGISPERTTLPRALKAKGYLTHHIGKWHVGNLDALARPFAQGFDSTLSFDNQWRLSGKSDDNGDIIPNKPTYFDPWLSENGQREKQYKGHLNDILTERALSIIEEADAAPWFINLWYYAPHSPIEPASRYTGGKKRRDQRPEYYQMLVEQMDSNIGRILDRLEHSGQMQNTLIVFASDNGGTNKQVNNNAPFAGRKNTLREGGTRVPLIIAPPRFRFAGSYTQSTSSIRDIFPTIMELATGDHVPGLEGASLAPLLQKQPVPQQTLIWETYNEKERYFSILNAEGTKRYALPFTLEGAKKSVVINDLLNDPTGTTYTRTFLDEFNAPDMAIYEEWHRTVHAIPIDVQDMADGLYKIAGDSLQRTPGYGRMTLAFAVSDTKSTNANTGLMEQKGAWKLSYNHDSEILTLSVLGSENSGRASLKEACNSIIISGRYRRKITPWTTERSDSQISLYLNSQLLAEVSIEETPSVADPLEPTWLGSFSEGVKPFKGTIGRPIMLNLEALPGEPYSPSTIHQMLCPS